MTEIYHYGHRDSRREMLISHDEVDYTDYRFEVARLDSFVRWNVSFMDPRKLAAAGFYYTGRKDEVKCFECQGSLCDWVENDNPMVEHQRWLGRCRFVRNIACGNVPIGVDPNTIPSYFKRKKDVSYESYGLKYKPFSGPDNDLKFEEWIAASLDKSQMERTISRSDLDAEYLEYASYTRRLQSFKSWPEEKAQKKEDLAAAGFYYSGFSDQTLCYHCGIGLKNWEPKDVPMQEHIKWSPECQFIKRIQTNKQSREDDQDVPPEPKTEDVSPSRESKTPNSP